MAWRRWGQLSTRSRLCSREKQELTGVDGADVIIRIAQIVTCNPLRHRVFMNSNKTSASVSRDQRFRAFARAGRRGTRDLSQGRVVQTRADLIDFDKRTSFALRLV